jgi:hypothetical protein
MSILYNVYIFTHIMLTHAENDHSIDISQYRLLFKFFLLYTDRVPFELLDSAALLKGKLRWRGGGGK